MNVFHLYYLLSQACLFEISNNFRCVAFGVEENVISIYFILYKEIEDDLYSINEEIISEFETLLYSFLDSSDLDTEYSFKHNVIINERKEFDIRELCGLDKIEVLFMRKWG